MPQPVLWGYSDLYQQNCRQKSEIWCWAKMLGSSARPTPPANANPKTVLFCKGPRVANPASRLLPPQNTFVLPSPLLFSLPPPKLAGLSWCNVVSGSSEAGNRHTCTNLTTSEGGANMPYGKFTTVLNARNWHHPRKCSGFVLLNEIFTK